MLPDQSASPTLITGVIPGTPEIPYVRPVDGVLPALNRGGAQADPQNAGATFHYLKNAAIKAMASVTYTPPLTGSGTGGVFDENQLNNWDWGPSSQHPGGANHVMADGSVQFINDSIQPVSYFALATRAGKEPTGSEGAPQ